MRYDVSLAVDGRVTVSVDADTFDEAKQKATLDDVDLSAMEVIGYSAVNAENEKGEFKDY